MTLVAKLNPARLSAALAWRFRTLVGDQRVDRAIVKVAQAWRGHLRKPVFIGIAGSAGKTTTKELLHGVLSYRQRGLSNPSSLNALPEVAKVILRLRPAHDFCIAELSEDKPGIMDAPLVLFRPSIGIVTVVGNDHWSAFGSRDGIAGEVGKLVAALPESGTAVLNADDEAVLSMAKGCVAKVITYGRSPTATLRAEDVRSVWPKRLQMTLVYGAEQVDVRTQLCGTHWLPAALGAIGGGLSVGMTLAECAEAIASVAPFDGRMQPVTTHGGVTFIRDDWKAPLWTVDSCLDFMQAARATRKVLVIGTLSDCGAGAPEKYIKVARRAQEIADLTVFVGPWASQVLKARKPGAEDALRVFRNVRDAAEYLKAHIGTEDLVLLKGTNKQDHLSRLVLARQDGVACWRDDCQRHVFCSECPDRNVSSGLPVLMGHTADADTDCGTPQLVVRAVGTDEMIIVGLGNPELKYAGTPHNIGYEVVDQLAAALSLTWEAGPEGWIARGLAQSRPVCLVKLKTAMNLTGAGLLRLSQGMVFAPEQCVLVHDDLDLPLGGARTRMGGGAGNHRGVASILEAFQSDAFRRVKVGVGQTGATLNRADYVLTPFAADRHTELNTGLTTAHARLVELTRSRPS
ncbi:aminoacyl-tRNA hydrolase [Rhodoferax sp.]|uniref:aminoacyl-tRNA hydrolase n=1 Tax=Rhodoferax sp. TaxID=50421 RepID=UPI00276E015A|nr:aminoacyl-tRNA hydrolase [Rhodoferax sp.]